MQTEHDKLYEALRKVFDPELDINIVDMGLIIHMEYDRSQQSIDIIMTLTSPGCPMGEVIIDNVYDILAEAFPFVNTTVHLVWEPAWSIERMTPEGRQLLSIV